VASQVLSLNKALDEMSPFCSDFPVEGPARENQAAVPFSKARKEGQHVEDIDIAYQYNMHIIFYTERRKKRPASRKQSIYSNVSLIRCWIIRSPL
jgi:hypothetical protein